MDPKFNERMADEAVAKVQAQQSIVEFTSNGPTIKVGSMTIRELADGSIWLENKIGEGMQVASENLESILIWYHHNHF